MCVEHPTNCNISSTSRNFALFGDSSFNSEKKFNVSNLDVIWLQEIHSSIKDLNRFAKFSLPNKKVIFSCINGEPYPY